MLLILVLLGLVFRSVIIAVLPIVVIGVVHQMAQAITADLADWFHFVVGPELAPLLVVVMFGVGTDYIVFLLFRYRERMAAGDEPRTACCSRSWNGWARSSPRPAATVIAAFAALLVASLESLRTLAPGLIVGVALMLLAALTLVPGHLQPARARPLLAGAAPARHVGPPDPFGAARGHGGQATRRGAGVWSGVLVGLALGRAGLQDHLQPAGRAPVVHPVPAGLQHHGLRLPRRATSGPPRCSSPPTPRRPLDGRQSPRSAATLAKTTGRVDGRCRPSTRPTRARC